MQEGLRVTLVANAGLLLRYGETALLLDAVFGAEGAPFSPVPDAVWRDMLEGRGAFSRIDYLLFSHDHPDHLSGEMAKELIGRRPVKGLLLPDGARSLGCGIAKVAAERGVGLMRPCGVAEYRLGPDIAVMAIPTRHLDEKYRDVQHFCYLISFGEKRVLFTADVDYTTQDLRGPCGGPLDAMFVNPLYFHMLRTPGVFGRSPEAKTVVAYHVPFAGDDAFNMRALLERDLRLWNHEARTAALSEPAQELWL